MPEAMKKKKSVLEQLLGVHGLAQEQVFLT